MSAAIRGHHATEDLAHEVARSEGQTMWCCAMLAAEREQVIEIAAIVGIERALLIASDMLQAQQALQSASGAREGSTYLHVPDGTREGLRRQLADSIRLRLAEVSAPLLVDSSRDFRVGDPIQLEGDKGVITQIEGNTMSVSWDRRDFDAERRDREMPGQSPAQPDG